VVNGIVYAGNSYESLYDLKGTNGSLYATRCSDGKERWRFVMEIMWIDLRWWRTVCLSGEWR